MKRGWLLLLALSVLLVFSGPANAALMTIGTATYSGTNYNLIYEDDQGLVWLDYTNSFNTWQNQVNLVSGLNLTGVLTYNLNALTSVSWGGDWRLPSAGLNPQIGYNQKTSEMGHLYYESLGKAAGGPLGDTTPFEDLQAAVYWSGTEYSYYTDVAWAFYFGNGYQSTDDKVNARYALAVRPGEVSSYLYPRPCSFWSQGWRVLEPVEIG